MAIPSIVKSLRVLGDANRLRMLLLLSREELSVAELQEILGMGQSTISTHLAQLKHAGMVEDRRAGKNIWYRSKSGGSPVQNAGAVAATEDLPEARHDQAALELVLRKRQDKTRAFFDDMAGRLGREYVPGRSWKSIAEALLLMLPPMVIADLGAGEGAFSLLLAQRAQQVIAVDNSDKMVELGSDLARKQGVPALEYRKGDLEAVPIADGSVDLALFSQSLHHAQHPERAVAEAWRILKPGGQDRDSGPGAAPFCRSARVIRRRLAGLQRSGAGATVEQGRVRKPAHRRRAQRNQSPLFPDCVGNGDQGDPA